MRAYFDHQLVSSLTFSAQFITILRLRLGFHVFRLQFQLGLGLFRLSFAVVSLTIQGQEAPQAQAALSFFIPE